MSFQSFYSKKVLDHIRHPRNMGEIKNPDGAATVGNRVCGDVMRLYVKIGKKNGKEYIKEAKFQTLGCLPFEEEVVLSNGKWEKIGRISPDIKVLNGEGKEAYIGRTLKRKYNGVLLRIVPFISPFNSFSLTPDHPVLAIKRKWIRGARKTSSKCNWLQIRREDKLFSTPPQWIKADLLEEGDYLVFTYNQKTVDDPAFSPFLMRLLGYYLAEGYITGGSVINFSFNKKEKRQIAEVKKLVYELTGKKTSERTRGQALELRFCSKKWADFLVSLGGKLARGKRLSKRILLLPFEKQWEMIRTYILGDGDSYRRRRGDPIVFRAITTSRDLAIQIQEILARGGIFASIKEIFKTNCIIGGRKLKDSIQYLIRFQIKRKHKFFHKIRGGFLISIREIEKKKFNGVVYNLQLALEPNSYLVRGFVVHNCGAAIATSSIITTMVKGKPLEEAEKISEKAIAEALGGLPPVKFHCSVLAAEALKKAIENYRKKKVK